MPDFAQPQPDKHCTVCHREIPPEIFPKHFRRCDGNMSRCNEFNCPKWRRENP